MGMLMYGVAPTIGLDNTFEYHQGLIQSTAWYFYSSYTH